jgi:hypothetical protein
VVVCCSAMSTSPTLTPRGPGSKANGRAVRVRLAHLRGLVRVREDVGGERGTRVRTPISRRVVWTPVRARHPGPPRPHRSAPAVCVRAGTSGREWCTPGRVDTGEVPTREPSPVLRPWLLPAVYRPVRRRLRVPVGGLHGPVASIAGDPRAGSRSEHRALPRRVPRPRPRECAACCRGDRALRSQEDLWLDEASARRALAVPPLASRHASATAATSSRCSREPCASSRRRLNAAA